MGSTFVSTCVEYARYIDTVTVFIGAIALWLISWIAVGIYRVYFHPLASIPGPKLAALTFWYEFYYDVFPNRYQYGFKLKELHTKYGPIIRINPIHVHIHDHSYFDTIYASRNPHKRDRCSWAHHSGNKSLSGSMLEAMDHDHHKMRRSATGAFFSKRSVQALQPLVVKTTRELMSRMVTDMDRDIGEGGQGIVNLNCAYAAMTMDIISEYCFGQSMNAMHELRYGKLWLDTLHQGVQMRPLARQFPTVFNILLDMPPWFAGMFSANIKLMNEWNAQMLTMIERIMTHQDISEKTRHRTIFHEIRDDTVCKLPPEEKAPIRLMGEASTFLGAGTETTARTLAVTTYYLLKEEKVGLKLFEELKRIIPTRDTEVSLPQLEALPYLSSVVNEGLRVAHGVSSRQPRIATTEDLQYDSYTIPRGNAVMESAYLLHTDPEVYPKPFAFRPERWLDNPDLKKNLFAFGRGSRGCAGMNLATSELFYGIAFVWRWMELELWETEEVRDVRTNYDCFLGLASLGSECGIRVKVLGQRQE